MAVKKESTFINTTQRWQNALLATIVIGLFICIGGAVLYPALSRSYGLAYIGGFLLFTAVSVFEPGALVRKSS